jgi:hypothetical protein
MAEEQIQEQASKDLEEDLTIEDIQTLFAEILEQMSSASKKMTLLGKRLREDPMPDIEALEQTYLSLPVSSRPSWFEYIAQQEVVTTKKIARKENSY